MFNDLRPRRFTLLPSQSVSASQTYKATQLKSMGRQHKRDAIVSALWLTLAFTATEDGAGTALDWESVLKRIAYLTVRFMGKARFQNYSGIGLVKRVVLDETLRMDVRADYVQVADVAAGSGNQSITLKVPVLLARNLYRPGADRSRLVGGIPVGWFADNGLIEVGINSATICGSGANTWTMTSPTLEIEADIVDDADANVLPMVVEGELDSTDGNAVIEVPGTGDGERVVTLCTLEDADGSSAFVAPTNMNIRVDDETVDTDVDGDDLNDIANMRRFEPIDDLFNKVIVVVSPNTPDSDGLHVTGKFELENAGTQHAAAGDDHTLVRYRYQYTPTESWMDKALKLQGVGAEARAQIIKELYRGAEASISDSLVFDGDLPAAPVRKRVSSLAASGVTAPKVRLRRDI